MWDKVLRSASLCVCALGLYWMRWLVMLPFAVSWWSVRLAWNHCLWRPSWIGTAVTALWHGCERPPHAAFPRSHESALLFHAISCRSTGITLA